MNFISYCPINLRCFYQILELPCFLNTPFTSQFDGKVIGNAIGISFDLKRQIILHLWHRVQLWRCSLLCRWNGCPKCALRGGRTSALPGPTSHVVLRMQKAHGGLVAVVNCGLPLSIPTHSAWLHSKSILFTRYQRQGVKCGSFLCYLDRY